LLKGGSEATVVDIHHQALLVMMDIVVKGLGVLLLVEEAKASVLDISCVEGESNAGATDILNANHGEFNAELEAEDEAVLPLSDPSTLDSSGVEIASDLSAEDLQIKGLLVGDTLLALLANNRDVERHQGPDLL